MTGTHHTNAATRAVKLSNAPPTVTHCFRVMQFEEIASEGFAVIRVWTPEADDLSSILW